MVLSGGEYGVFGFKGDLATVLLSDLALEDGMGFKR
jgi:hypothetical protein